METLLPCPAACFRSSGAHTERGRNVYDRAEQQKRRQADVRELESLRSLETELYGRLLRAYRYTKRQRNEAPTSPSYDRSLGFLAALRELVAEHLNVLATDVESVLKRDDGGETVRWLRHEFNKIRRD